MSLKKNKSPRKFDSKRKWPPIFLRLQIDFLKLINFKIEFLKCVCRFAQRYMYTTHVFVHKCTYMYTKKCTFERCHTGQAMTRLHMIDLSVKLSVWRIKNTECNHFYSFRGCRNSRFKLSHVEIGTLQT